MSISPTIGDLVKAKVSEEQSNALLMVLESQRQSDRNAFRMGLWMISSVFAAAAAATGIIIAVLK